MSVERIFGDLLDRSLRALVGLYGEKPSVQDYKMLTNATMNYIFDMTTYMCDPEIAGIHAPSEVMRGFHALSNLLMLRSMFDLMDFVADGFEDKEVHLRVKLACMRAGMICAGAAIVSDIDEDRIQTLLDNIDHAGRNVDFYRELDPAEIAPYLEPSRVGDLAIHIYNTSFKVPQVAPVTGSA